MRLANAQKMNIAHRATTEYSLLLVAESTTTAIDLNWATACCPSQPETLMPHSKFAQQNVHIPRPKIARFLLMADRAAPMSGIS